MIIKKMKYVAGVGSDQSNSYLKYLRLEEKSV